ncbi:MULTISPECIES: hypothetical protein [Streptomyces]|uniref:hypothetical protein n=1 Tax=Streptomyces TaxID=1883 RepID=UPI000F64D58C|nr:hypothetical protein [Streptomyces griseofuscus]
MGSGFTFIFIPLFFYITLAVLLCVKIANNNSWKMGLLFATCLIFLPAGVLTLAGMYEAGAL